MLCCAVALLAPAIGPGGVDGSLVLMHVRWRGVMHALLMLALMSLP